MRRGEERRGEVRRGGEERRGEERRGEEKGGETGREGKRREERRRCTTLYITSNTYYGVPSSGIMTSLGSENSPQFPSPIASLTEKE